MPIARSVLANLESGRRDSISVAEILVLARALRVPPALLIVPLGREETAEILPGRQVATWPAFMWLGGDIWSGAANGQTTLALGTPGWAEIELFRDHEYALNEWSSNLRDLKNAEISAQTAETENIKNAIARRADHLTEALQNNERHIRVVRARIREEGLIPPPLPQALAHLEEA